ncbi:MAG: hypothetical protein KBD78_03910 [Oligoflexales bacterium]|nr:hypothetical protein [Oligoflexales bacterium]
MIQIPAPNKTGDNKLDEFLRWIYNVLTLGFLYKQTRVAADYTITKDDFYIGVTSTSAPRALTLPSLASIPKESMYVIKDESGGAGTNNITVDGSGTETIDGSLTKVINTNYGALRLMNSGSAWFSW